MYYHDAILRQVSPARANAGRGYDSTQDTHQQGRWSKHCTSSTVAERAPPLRTLWWLKNMFPMHHWNLWPNHWAKRKAGALITSHRALLPMVLTLCAPCDGWKICANESCKSALCAFRQSRVNGIFLVSDTRLTRFIQSALRYWPR